MVDGGPSGAGQTLRIVDPVAGPRSEIIGRAKRPAVCGEVRQRRSSPTGFVDRPGQIFDVLTLLRVTDIAEHTGLGAWGQSGVGLDVAADESVEAPKVARFGELVKVGAAAWLRVGLVARPDQT